MDNAALGAHLTAELSMLIDYLADEPVATDPRIMVSTGISPLDSLLDGGIRGGQLVLLGGATGIGVSMFALDLARRAAYLHDLQTLLLAASSSRRENQLRIVSAETRIPLRRLRTHELTDADRARVGLLREKLVSGRLVVDGDWTTPATASAIADSARSWIRSGTQVLVIDDLQHAEGRTRDLVKDLRLLTKPQNVVVMVSRTVAPPGPTAPRLTDLRYHEEALDLVDSAIVLHRPDFGNPESPRAGEVDFIVAKNRHGALRTVTASFSPHKARFQSIVANQDGDRVRKE